MQEPNREIIDKLIALFNERKYLEALDVILASKVDPYWKRKRKNDNYDLYLKTIAQAWINSVYISADVKQQKALNRWKQDFEKRPKYADENVHTYYHPIPIFGVLQEPL